MSQLVQTQMGIVEFPDSLSPEEIKIILQAKFGTPKKPAATVDSSTASSFPQNPRTRGSTVRPSQEDSTSVLEFLKNNMEIPGGIGGSLAGVAAGAPFGPPGMVVGGILGGAVGSGAGSISSDLLNDREVSYAEALKEAALSAGFDVATLGLGKVLKPALAPLIKKAFKDGKTAEEVLKDIVKESGGEAAEAGSRESLAASQKILSEKGATLLPTQIGEVGSAAAMEKIARVGLLSSGKIEDNARAVNTVVAEELQSLFNKNYVDVSSDPMSLGQAAFDIINAGKRAISDSYVAGLDEIGTRVGRKQVAINPVLQTIESFNKSYEKEGLGSVLSKPAQQFIKSLSSRLEGNSSMQIPVSSLIELDKLVTREVSEFADVNSQKYNSIAASQLTELSNALKDTVGKMLTNFDKETSTIYSSIKKEYSEGMSGLLPKINETFVNNANKQNYDSLGKIIAGNGNISQLIALKNSLKEAFKRTSKESRDVPGFISEADADKLIKKAFLEDKFPALPNGQFDMTEYAHYASKFSRPKERQKLKVILGDDYNRVKQLTNLMAEASGKPQSNLGQFVIRSKEYETISKTLQLVGTGAASTTGPMGWVGSGALLLAPRFMASYVTNPKNVNKLIAFQNTKFKSQAAFEKAATLLLDDLWTSISDTDRQEVLESLFDLRDQEQTTQGVPQ